MLLSKPTKNNLLPTEQIALFPATRYMGSKSKLLNQIWAASEKFEFDSVLDLFSGSGVVSYMYKAYGKRVISNDYMAMGGVVTKALIENSNVMLSDEDVKILIIVSGYQNPKLLHILNGHYGGHFLQLIILKINHMKHEALI